MINKNAKLFACIFALAVLFSWTGYVAVNSNTGETVEFKITGYDPRDLLSGHYLTYTVDFGVLESRTENRRAYLCLDDKTVYPQKPSSCALGLAGEYYKWNKAFNHRGIDRFYIPEEYAQRLDKALRSGKHDAKIKVLITKNGAAYVKEMYFDGIAVREFAEKIK
ncbi:MAG: GDYXXLXY domain-containing protein [Elusimicrobiota bacterium]|jgi:uncharacterized membrane-anchored protein|nr:GDYXXLXY domain-containing protein [Elusimicrobiota bacterium]